MAASAAVPCAHEEELSSTFDFTATTLPTGGAACVDDMCSDGWTGEDYARLFKAELESDNRYVEAAVQELGKELSIINSLGEQLDNVQRLKEEAQETQVAATHAGGVAREAAAAAARRSAVAARAAEGFKQVLHARLAECEVEEAKLAAQEAAAEERLTETDRLFELYRAGGLAIERVAPRTVRMTFLRLDERDLGAACSFVLGLAEEGGGYEVSGCSPALPAGLLEALVARLNVGEPGKQTALPAFMCRMRRAFLDSTRTRHERA